MMTEDVLYKYLDLLEDLDIKLNTIRLNFQLITRFLYKDFIESSAYERALAFNAFNYGEEIEVTDLSDLYTLASIEKIGFVTDGKSVQYTIYLDYKVIKKKIGKWIGHLDNILKDTKRIDMDFKRLKLFELSSECPLIFKDTQFIINGDKDVLNMTNENWYIFLKLLNKSEQIYDLHSRNKSEMFDLVVNHNFDFIYTLNYDKVIHHCLHTRDLGDIYTLIKYSLRWRDMKNPLIYCTYYTAQEFINLCMTINEYKRSVQEKNLGLVYYRDELSQDTLELLDSVLKSINVRLYFIEKRKDSLFDY